MSTGARNGWVINYPLERGMHSNPLFVVVVVVVVVGVLSGFNWKSAPLRQLWESCKGGSSSLDIR